MTAIVVSEVPNKTHKENEADSSHKAIHEHEGDHGGDSLQTVPNERSGKPVVSNQVRLLV
jgi:hypothetical protein